MNPSNQFKLLSVQLYWALILSLLVSLSLGETVDLPYYLQDRGLGQPTSMFATYINEGEFIFYPFYEYYHDEDAEYNPEEFDYNLDVDFEAKFEGHEVLLFFGYGFSENFAVEFESAWMWATQWKADEDGSDMPEKIEEDGLGDVEGQLRWRWNRETEQTPEYFSYLEIVFPLADEKKLIGTQDWEYKLGSGIIKGFAWGTLASRVAVEYDGEEGATELGEFALEYIRRWSPTWRTYTGVEGTADEVEFIVDLQYHFRPNAFIRINNAIGITPAATDYAPEIGILFYF